MPEPKPHPTSQPGDKYIVRFPDGLRDQMKALAAENNRSLNAEIIARLQQSLDPRSVIPTQSQEDRLVAAHEKIAILAQHISILKSILRNAANIIRTALISGRDGKIPESDAAWMSKEADHFLSVAGEGKIDLDGTHKGFR